MRAAYTYWGYRFSARANNKGWRLDYFLVSPSIKQAVKQVALGTELTSNRTDGDRRSDHIPISLVLKF